MSVKIVGFGNSLTYGYLVNKGYIDFLKEKLKHIEIINAGIPGDTALEGLRRIRYSVLKHHPGITIVEFGVNDAFVGYSVKEFEENYLNILKQIPNKKIIMIPHRLKTVFDWKIVKPFYDKLREIADKNKLPVIDVSKFQLDSSQLLSDGLHPNENGYKLYAEEAYKVIVDFLE
jgi:lysophospholipase L1-like esterase